MKKLVNNKKRITTYTKPQQLETITQEKEKRKKLEGKTAEKKKKKLQRKKNKNSKLEVLQLAQEL